MKNILTAELLVDIRNTADQLPAMYKSMNDDFVIYKQHEDYYVICNIAPRNKNLSAVSVVYVADKEKFDAYTYWWAVGDSFIKFLETLAAHSKYNEEIGFNVRFHYRMSPFIFEQNNLTGMYYQLSTNKRFYYFEGKKQEEKQDESTDIKRNSNECK